MSPEYLYVCENSHFHSVVHSMSDDPKIKCIICGERMWRKPQASAINWEGSKPSGGGPAPDVQRLIDTAPERKDEFLRRHEEHERRTED